MQARQLPLSFEHRPALEGDDFLVAAPNADAVAWLDRWPDWPAPALVVWGAPGCGKSHLVSAFKARSGARDLAAEQIGAAWVDEPGLKTSAADPVRVVDGIEHLLTPETEEPLFHLFNRIRGRTGVLLISASAPPARWRVGLADLRSRLVALPSVEISAPDDPLLAAILVKQFADRQVRIDQDVVSYLLPRMERSFAAVGRLVADIDAEALARKRRITVPLVRDVLQAADNE